MLIILGNRLPFSKGVLETSNSSSQNRLEESLINCVNSSVLIKFIEN